MARCSIEVDASPQEVFDVLLDSSMYPRWVVGARKHRGVDQHWPTVGAAFYHQSWMGAIPVNDRTVLTELDVPKRIRLDAAVRPAMIADVTISVEPIESGSRITIDERPKRGPLKLVWNPVFDAAMDLRNREALRRLKRLVERNAARG